MKRFLSMGMAFCLSITMLAACQRSKGVHAGSEDDYQPRSAPPSAVDTNKHLANPSIQGEVIAVDMGDRTMVIRLENGTEPKYKWNDDTKVTGLPAAKDSTTTANMKVLSARPGTPVVIETLADKGQMMTTVIEVR